MSKKTIKKDDLAYLCGSIRKKETFSSSYQISFMPFRLSELPTDEKEKWVFLTKKAVNYLIDQEELPTFTNAQDYTYSDLTYSAYNILESVAYQLDKTEQKEIKVFNNVFDKIILPIAYREKIIEVIAQLKDGKKIFDEWGLGEKITKGRGINLLFNGESGTGKTYCGEIIAQYIGTTFEVVSVASIESKWSGESEKNIQQIFKSLQGGNKVLILDEVDSFMSSRSTTDHIYQQKLTNQFLIELERHNGICVMTTNRPVILDRALQRRIDLVLDFPNPNQEARKQIWKFIIPEKMPTKNIDFDKLSTFEINGGTIKNCILAAARKAILRNEKVSNDIIIEAIIEEQEEIKNLKNGKDHS